MKLYLAMQQCHTLLTQATTPEDYETLHGHATNPHLAEPSEDFETLLSHSIISGFF